MWAVVTSDVMGRSGEGKGEFCLFHRLGLDNFKRSSNSKLLVRLRLILKSAAVGGEHMDTAGSTAGAGGESREIFMLGVDVSKWPFGLLGFQSDHICVCLKMEGRASNIYLGLCKPSPPNT